jgi:hypothetical protein
MKKIAIIFLLICYLIPTIGMAVSAHYCGGKLASVSLVLSKAEKCKCGGKTMKKDCCKTNTCNIKIKTDQQSTAQLEIDFNKTFSAQHTIAYPSSTDIFSAASHTDFYKHYLPPRRPAQTLYLLNGVFRI